MLCLSKKNFVQIFIVLLGLQIAEDMRERWETSDHPVVHKIQEYVVVIFSLIYISVLKIGDN